MRTRELLQTWILATAVLTGGCVMGADDGTDDAAGETEEEIALIPARNLFAEPRGRAVRNPIVLAHGFDASPTNRWGFNRVAEALRADGHRVFIATVPP